MRIKILILCLFSVIGTGVQAQKNKAIKTFEKDLNLFRYGLYKDLNGKSYQEISGFDFDADDSITIKINTFCLQNAERIHDFRKARLQQYLDFNVDLTNCFPDTLFNGRAQELMSDYCNEELAKYSVAKLFMIDPFDNVYFVITMLASRILSTQGFAVESLKDKVAYPLVQTRNINSNEWEIIVDKYERVYRFLYNLETGNINKLEVLVRRP